MFHLLFLKYGRFLQVVPGEAGQTIFFSPKEMNTFVIYLPISGVLQGGDAVIAWLWGSL